MLLWQSSSFLGLLGWMLPFYQFVSSSSRAELLVRHALFVQNSQAQIKQCHYDLGISMTKAFLPNIMLMVGRVCCHL